MIFIRTRGRPPRGLLSSRIVCAGNFVGYMKETRRYGMVVDVGGAESYIDVSPQLYFILGRF
jgi:hypothetical protein